MRTRTRTREVLIPVVVVIAAVAVALVVAFTGGSSDRFGDPGTLADINSSTDCGELREIADRALADMAANRSDEEFDRAVGYSNAAHDRMDELGC